MKRGSGLPRPNGATVAKRSASSNDRPATWSAPSSARSGGAGRPSPGTTCDPLGQEGLERRQPAGLEGQPGRHRVPAALEQEPGLARGDHRAAEIEAGDRARRALADAIGGADHHRRPVVALDQARRDQAQHAGRPAFADREEERGVALERRRDLRLGRRHQLALEPAPLLVEPLQT